MKVAFPKALIRSGITRGLVAVSRSVKLAKDHSTDVATRLRNPAGTANRTPEAEAENGSNDE